MKMLNAYITALILAILSFPASATPIYAISDAGDMLFYMHTGTTDGSPNWQVHAKKIGTGWNFKHVFAGINGAVYAITETGDMLFYRHTGMADGSPNWAVQGKKIGSGWNFKHVFRGENGALYAITETGDMLFYKHAGGADGSPNWSVQAKKIDTGWNFEQAFAGTAQPALAAPQVVQLPVIDEKCDAYARRAVAQYRRTMDFPKCRVRPDARWHDNYQSHYHQCLTTQRASSHAEEKARDDHLDRCGGQTRFD